MIIAAEEVLPHGNMCRRSKHGREASKVQTRSKPQWTSLPTENTLKMVQSVRGVCFGWY